MTSGPFPLGVPLEPYYEGQGVTLFHGDCIEVLRQLPDCSVDSVVTDPPYALGFMGREWDSFGGVKGITDPAIRKAQQEKWGTAFGASARPAKPAEGEMVRFQLWSQEWAAEALRVLKPGGHLLAFGGTRTWHRLAVAIEDAGFEIRDSIAWMYGSGFPKSLDVSKAIDKAAGAEREVVSIERSPFKVDNARDNATAYMSAVTGDTRPMGDDGYQLKVTTAPATPDAARWQGWGTALKPAHEPIVVARKPLTGTVAANVLEHGTGALNIDGCRIATEDKLGGGHSLSGQQMSDGWRRPWMDDPDAVAANAARSRANVAKAEELGRWPANVVLDEDQAAALDQQSGQAGGGYGVRGAGGRTYANGKGFANTLSEVGQTVGYGDSGGASRFFYVAKAPARERPKVDGIAHPTVKPLTLMRWLCRLVTPPGGIVLEPFAGSGTTVQAALAEGFRCIAVEREDDYLPLILSRLTPEEPADGQLTLDASA